VFLAKVYVTLKPTVNDPQGLTIKGGLHSLGFASVESVRAGKYMEIRLDGGSREEAERLLNEMCKQLLANPIIENYRFELGPLPPNTTPGDQEPGTGN
jgi:phosphoribosylformylglycinamidine synthase PurS subunit